MCFYWMLFYTCGCVYNYSVAECELTVDTLGESCVGYEGAIEKIPEVCVSHAWGAENHRDEDMDV